MKPIMSSRRMFLAGLANSALLASAALTGPALASPTNGGKNARDLVLPTDPVLGNPKGDVTLLDFYDIRCPPCRQMEPRITRLMAADAGLRYVPIDYPLFGAPSEMAARALLAAQMQNHYAEYKKWLYANFERPNMDLMQRAATALKLDWVKMQSDMHSPAMDDRIKTNMARGAALGVKVLPVMLLGPIVIPGALHYADMLDLVQSARKQQV